MIRTAAILALASVLPLLAQCPQHDAFWAHVYRPQRLAVQKACVSVTGVIVDATAGKRKDGVRHERDGDSHGWLKLDPGQEQYLNAGNKKVQDGNLVFEIVCLFRDSQPDAISACKGYHSAIKLPPVGTHVKITGTWVQDLAHEKWLEIHPVMDIEPTTSRP